MLALSFHHAPVSIVIGAICVNTLIISTIRRASANYNKREVYMIVSQLCLRSPLGKCDHVLTLHQRYYDPKNDLAQEYVLHFCQLTHEQLSEITLTDGSLSGLLFCPS
jgi:hypothetical protein